MAIHAVNSPFEIN